MGEQTKMSLKNNTKSVFLGAMKCYLVILKIYFNLESYERFSKH